MPSINSGIVEWNSVADYVVGDMISKDGEISVVTEVDVSGIATTASVGGHTHGWSPVIEVSEDSVIRVADEEITGRDLAMFIKLMKREYPEVFI